MPEHSPRTPSERAKAQPVKVHPRVNGDLILEPDDILEGQGNFTVVEDDGTPPGFDLGNVEEVDGHHVYEGYSPTEVTRQTTAVVERNSVVLRNEHVEGDPLPDARDTVKIPPAPKPIVKTVAAERMGFPESTEERPIWYAWTRIKGNKHTKLSPPVACSPNGTGQGLELPLPETTRDERIGLWLSEPGRSTSQIPRNFYLQAIVDAGRVQSNTYKLNGPFNYNLKKEPTRNETRIQPPSGYPRLTRRLRQTAARATIYFARVTAAEKGGRDQAEERETLAGRASRSLEIKEDRKWDEDKTGGIGGNKNVFIDFGGSQPTGNGSIRVYRPSLPAGSVGWYAYLIFEGESYRVYNRETGLGLTRPLPASWRYIETPGAWDGSEKHGKNDSNLVKAHELPTINGTGEENPDTAPEPGIPFGAVGPAPGRRYYRVTDTVKDKESRPSPAVALDLAAGEIPRIIFGSHSNKIPNECYTETDPDKLPMDRQIFAPVGAVRVEEQTLVMETLEGNEALTHQEQTDWVEVDPALPASFETEFELEAPEANLPEGEFQSLLQEQDASGNITSSILVYSADASEIGEHEYTLEINPATTDAFFIRPAWVWGLNTKFARIVNRFFKKATTNRANIKVRMRRTTIRDHRSRPRPNRKPRVTATPKNPRPPRPVPPGPPGGGKVRIDPPPKRPSPPKPIPTVLRPVPFPDRPLSTGTVLEDLQGFEGTPGIPAGWTKNQSPASPATELRLDPIAAITGAQGLLLKDTSTASQAIANISKTFASIHSLGLRAQCRFAQIAGQGRLSLNEIRNPSGQRNAWLELISQSEAATLRITAAPEQPGNVSLTLDAQKKSIAVAAARQVEQLKITAAPTNFGTITIGLGTKKYNIQTGGQEAVYVLNVQAPRANGHIQLIFDGVTRNIPAYKGDTPKNLGNRIRRTPIAGWKVTGRNNRVVFEARQPGPKEIVYRRSTSGTPASLEQATVGANDTAVELADRIRATRFPGWAASGSATTVNFTAARAGLRDAPSVAVRATGAVATITTLTAGSRDTAAALAAKIRATVFTGWTLSGSGELIVIKANNSGVRWDPYFHPGPTQTEAELEVTEQGADLSLIACARAGYGSQTPDVRRRTIATGIALTDVLDVDQAISGAGTKEAIVTTWLTLNSGAKKHVARFEDLDMSEGGAALQGSYTAHLGVTAESVAGLTWTLHIDNPKVTDRGIQYHRDHDYLGALLNQVAGYFVPAQPFRDDLMLQPEQGEIEQGAEGKRIATVANQPYLLSAWVRHRDVRGNQKPLFLTAIDVNGKKKNLGCLTGAAGITGDSDWKEYKFPYTPGNGFYELQISSRHIGGGEIVIQEIVDSPGTVPKRTPLYETSGSSVTTLRRGSVTVPDNLLIERTRRLLETEADTPLNTAVAVLYRSTTDPLGGLWSPWVADKALVPDREYLEIHTALSGTGLNTPVLLAGSPAVHYAMTLSGFTIATLTKENGAELVGGAVFGTLEESAEIENVGIREMPDGRVDYKHLFPAREQTPPSVVWVFTNGARRYIEENWHKELLRIEAWGNANYVKLREQPIFTRGPMIGAPGSSSEDSFYLYSAELSQAQIERAEILP